MKRRVKIKKKKDTSFFHANNRQVFASGIKQMIPGVFEKEK